jgi:hypothetical protein
MGGVCCAAQSDPSKPLGVIYACTASGRPFPLELDSTISEKRRFVFVIRNPSHNWVLAAAVRAHVLVFFAWSHRRWT